MKYKIRDDCKEFMDILFNDDNARWRNDDNAWWTQRQAWRCLCMNESPYAIELLEKNPNKIEWEFLPRNKNAIHLLKQNVDQICWSILCQNNENCLQIIENMTVEELNAKYDIHLNPKTNVKLFDCLHSNPGVVKFLEKHKDKLNWDLLSSNYNAMHLIKANMDKVNWNGLSENKNAIELLLQNPEKIDWTSIAINENAIGIIEKNFDKLSEISSIYLSKNANALDILKQHPEKINFPFLIKNKSKEALDIYINHALHLPFSRKLEILQHSCVFVPEYDYDEMRKQMQESGLAEDIISTALHPDRVTKWVELGFDDF